MAEYSRLAKGSFTSTGATKAIYLPFAPDTVKLWNFSSYAVPTQNEIPRAYWDISMGQGYALVDIFNATPVLTTSVVLSNGISTFSAGQLLQFGPKIQIVSAAKSSAPTGGTSFTVAANTFSAGDVVVFEGLYQTPTTGMPQICGIPMVVSSATSTTFAINWNTNGSNYTSLSGSPTGAYVRKVLYPFLYEPGVAYVQSTTTGNNITVVTTAPHNFVTGQSIYFKIPTAWGPTELNELPNLAIPGSPVRYFVSSVVDNQTFVCTATATTAFNNNQPVSSVPGLQFPQVCAMGDVNTGGAPYTGGSLYPSPMFPTSTGTSTINGPAIYGAYVNNTASGFVVGTGAASSAAASSLIGSSGDVFYWEATLHDFS